MLVDPSGLCGWAPWQWADCPVKGAEALFRIGKVAVSKVRVGARTLIRIDTEYNPFFIPYRQVQSLIRDYKRLGGGWRGALDAINLRNPGLWFWMHEHGCRSAAAAGNGRAWARECTLAAANLLELVGTSVGGVKGGEAIVGEGSAAEVASGAEPATGVSSVFHHTTDQALDSILRQGLREGSYATPTAELTPLQAHLELSLNPAGGARTAVLEIDIARLRAAGYQIPKVTRVNARYGMPGGGYQVTFKYPVPPEFIKVIKR